MLNKIREAVSAFDQNRPRSKQTKLGASSVGGCRRQVSYILNGIEPTDTSSTSMAAFLGTGIHDALEKVFQEKFGAVTEVKLENDLLKSSADVVLEHGNSLTGVFTVLDIKTVSEYMFEKAKSEGPSRQQIWQVHLYSWLLKEAREHGDSNGLVALLFVNRNNGDMYYWEQEYDPFVTQQALDWIEECRAEPENVERNYHGPGISFVCDSCKWLTACWGPERPDGKPRQANDIKDDESVRRALQEYIEARDDEKNAKERKDFARALLSGAEPGNYDGMVLRWSSSGSRLIPDVDSIKFLLGTVPMKFVGTGGRLTVRRA